MSLIPLIDLLKRMNFQGVTDREKATLLKNLRARRQHLEEALKAVDRALRSLAQRPKRKKAAKRTTAKRAAKGG